MKRALLSISLVISFVQFSLSQVTSSNSCITPGSGGGSGNGNVVIFANYDGGVLNINVDQNIPNLKIGVCTYEPVTINITGTYAANVTEVRYAGYVSTNNHHCANSPVTTTINAPGGATTSVNFLPAANLSNPNGYSMIVCGYTCDNNSSQGGCNTRDQIEAYFTSSMNGTLFSYYTQYGCWSTTPYNVSAGTNCIPSSPADTTISSFSTSDISVCTGDPVNFSDLSPNAVSWSWTAPGSNTPSSSNQNVAGVTWNTAGTYTVTLTVNDGSGTCSTSQTITVTGTPNLNVSASPASICPGDTSLLQVSGASNFSWSNGPTAASQQVHPATSTWYQVTGTTNGCSSLDSVVVTVYAAPVIPNLVYTGGILQVTPVGFTYQWYLDGNLIAGATTSSYTPTQNGVYSVSYVDGNGCESAEDAFIVSDQTSGIETYGESIKIYPNPGKGLFYLDLPQLMNKEIKIEVTDALGKMIYTKATTFTQLLNIDLTGHAKGIYQLRIHSETKLYTGKLILE